MKKISNFLKKITGITFLQEVLYTLKLTSQYMEMMTRTFENVADVSERMSTQIRKTSESVDRYLESIRTDMKEVPELVNVSLKEISSSMSLVNENLKNLYKFSDDIKNGVAVNAAALKSVEIPVEKKPVKPSELYGIAVQNIGNVLCTNQPYGSAETVNNLFKLLTGSPIGGENSDPMLYWFLMNDTLRFEIVYSPIPGDIIISVTGKGTNPSDTGFVGIVGENGKVISEDVTNGKLSDQFTISSWVEYYHKQKGFPVEYFRVK